MNELNGIQTALDYIEEHLIDTVDYKKAAQFCCCSSYHFQRMFNVLCGCTLGEYIRNRRLTLAGIELQTQKSKVVDVALKYGYETPDSFTKAFRAFHGILPSQARNGGTLKFFSKRAVKIILEGAVIENYQIEQKPPLDLIGYKRRFTGDITERFEQEGDFFVTTRSFQDVLKELSADFDKQYVVYTNFSDDGYDCYIASKLDGDADRRLEERSGQPSNLHLDRISFPGGLYLVCETERCRYPATLYASLRKEAISGLLAHTDYQIRNAPEVSIFHERYRKNDPVYNATRYMELWLPIEEKPVQ